MQNKLQELTDKLYNEGLSKGKQEGKEIISKAKEEAEKIISEAKEEAEKIRVKATKDSEELKTNIVNDLKMASSQTISAVRQQIESAITAEVVNVPVKKAMSDTEFVKKLIETVIKAFNANNDAVELDVILPSSAKNEFDSFVKESINESLSSGVNVQFSKNIQNGFRISQKNGGYFIGFTDSDFEKLFGDYLRPTTRKILFGK